MAKYRIPDVNRRTRRAPSKYAGEAKGPVAAILMRAQDGKCAYCGRRITSKEMTLDHVLPRGVGGLDDVSNLLGVCLPCNHAKDNKMPSPEHEAIRRTIHAKIDWGELYA